MNKRLTWIIVGLVIILTVVGVILWQQNNSKKPKVYEFVGTVKESSSDGMLTVEGVYIAEKHPELNSPDQRRTVKIKIDPATVITRVSFRLPQPEELSSPNAVFYVDDLPKKQEKVGLDRLSQDLNKTSIDVSVKSKSNIYNKDTFIASEVMYRLPE